jgi:hypothetical protein
VHHNSIFPDHIIPHANGMPIATSIMSLSGLLDLLDALADVTNTAPGLIPLLSHALAEELGEVVSDG